MRLNKPANTLPFQPFLDDDLRTLRAAGAADIQLNGDRLEWTRTAPPYTFWMPEGEKVEYCLSAFSALAQRPSPERVLRFARKYGVLDLAPGGRPACGSPGFGFMAPEFRHQDGATVCWEPVAAYVAYARSALTFRALATELQRNEGANPYAVVKGLGFAASLDPTGAPEWEAIDQWCMMAGETRAEWHARTATPNHPGTHLLQYAPVHAARELWKKETTEPSRPPASVMRQRLVGRFQRLWIGPSGLLPILDWSTGERPRFTLGIGGPFKDSPPLFRILTLQLAAALMNEEQEYRRVCSNCGAVDYQPRRPRVDQPTLCSHCGDQANMMRVRRHRARRNAEE